MAVIVPLTCAAGQAGVGQSRCCLLPVPALGRIDSTGVREKSFDRCVVAAVGCNPVLPNALRPLGRSAERAGRELQMADMFAIKADADSDAELTKAEKRDR